MENLAIFIIMGVAVGILWFIDEILSFRNIKKYSIRYNKPPLVAWIMHHHAKGIIYIKLIIYLLFIVFAIELIRKYYLLFHIFTLILIILYLIFDIKVQRKLH